MFITGLFTAAKTGKQPKCPLINKWVKMLGNIYIYNICVCVCVCVCVCNGILLSCKKRENPTICNNIIAS